jgi:hypothetical protein
MKFTVSAAALCLVGFLFMDTPQRKSNRLQDRMNDAQMDEAFFLHNALNSTLPWERD